MRCTVHQLACGPDGACVLCKRRALSSSDPRASGGRAAVWLAGLGIVVSAGVAYRMAPRSAPLESSVASAEPSSPAARVDAPANDVRPEAPPAIDPAQAEQLRALQALARPSDPPRAPSSPPTAAPSAQAVDPRPAARTAHDPHVVVYTTGWCSVCKKAKQWMASSGVPYEERNVETSASAAEQMRIINPRGSVPTFDVDGEVLVGFSPESLRATMSRAAKNEAAREALREPW